MNRTSTPSQPETMRMRVLTEGVLADIIDSSETINSGNVPSRVRDEPTIVQPQDGEFQMPEFVDSSGRIDFDDILLWLQDEPAAVQSQDDMFQMLPPQVPEMTTMSSPILTDEGLADNINDSSGRIDFNDNSLRLESEPASVQPLRAPPEDDLYSTPLRRMTVEEIRLFVNSSGLVDFDAIALFQRNNPDSFPPQDDILPSRQPETTSHEAYQSKGLSVRTISKYVKTMTADEKRAQNIDGDRKICAVCLDDVCGTKDTVAILDECGHEFHYCCLKKWLRRKNICPLCRKTAIYVLQER